MFMLSKLSRARSIATRRVLLPLTSSARNRPQGSLQMASHIHTTNINHWCEISAEPINRYEPGGYHPIHLGDQLNNGRYKILHKLGWGGWSTTWAARDQQQQRYVTLKIAMAEANGNHEVNNLQLIASSLNHKHKGKNHIVQLFDSFKIEGPNGKHQCLVLELLGPSIWHVVHSHLQYGRLPAPIARSIAHQVLMGVDFLAQLDMGHGDIHTKNIALTLPNLDSLNEEEFVAKLGKPELGLVNTVDESALKGSGPNYCVEPAPFEQKDILRSLQDPVVKMIDFGGSFLSHQAPAKLHTPLPLRPPEGLFGDPIDRRVDSWSLGCLLFELFTGQAPFEGIILGPSDVIPQVIEFMTEEMPDRWKTKWQLMGGKPIQSDDYTLQKWLEEVYHYGERPRDLTQHDLDKIGEIIQRLMRWEPSLRSPAKDIANDPLFSSCSNSG